MAKYGTFKYKQAKYGFWSVSSSKFKFLRRYRIGTVITETVELSGQQRLRIKSNNDGSYLVSNVVPIVGEINKIRIRTDTGSFLISERVKLDGENT